MANGRTSPRLILASSSPRRRQILALLGVPYEVLVAAVAEQPLPGEGPEAAARRVALAKAQAAAARRGTGVVVGADTIVVLDGLILGKPVDAGEATRMLRALRGRCHAVITGVAVLNLDTCHQEVSAPTTEVCMRRYSEAEIAAYVAGGEPFDKAGAYAVQSAIFHPAATVRGCYLNVVGLPLCAVVASLCAVGFAVPPLAPARLADVCRSCLRRDILVRGCT